METEHPAKKIRFVLHTHSMTIQELAEQLGVTKECLREIVDEEARPTPHILHRICGIFGLKEDYFGEAMNMASESGEDENRKARGPTPRTGAPGRRRRKVDLAELAARHQALIDCLVAKKVLVARDYERRLETLRMRVVERQRAR